MDTVNNSNKICYVLYFIVDNRVYIDIENKDSTLLISD